MTVYYDFYLKVNSSKLALFALQSTGEAGVLVHDLGGGEWAVVKG